MITLHFQFFFLFFQISSKVSHLIFLFLLSLNLFAELIGFMKHVLPMKIMSRLEHETMNVCQRNVARFDHVECMFDKVNDIFQGFGRLMSLRLQKDGALKGNKSGLTYRTRTQTAQALVVRS